jgi:hypothetical protein
MTDYWSRIRNTLSTFAQPDDELECIGIYTNESTEKCQLCKEADILWVHLLHNSRTGQTLRVGRECIVNYKQVMAELGAPVQAVKFPPYYSKAAAYINKQKPNTVVVGPLSPLAQALSEIQQDLSKLRKSLHDERLATYHFES